MPIGKLLLRWIEVLASVYFACLDVLGARRAVIVACEGDEFTVRTMPPDADTRSAQPDEPGKGAEQDRILSVLTPIHMHVHAGARAQAEQGRILSVLTPGQPISAEAARAAHGGLVIFELPAAEVVVRRISVPAQAREFLPGIVRNQIERLSPWQSDQAAYGFDVNVNRDDPANLDVRVLIASRAAIDGVRDTLAAMGLVIDRIVTAQRHAGVTKFITLWSRLATLSREDLDRARWRIGAGIAAAILVCVGLSLWAMISAASLRAESDDAEARATVLRHQLEGAGGQAAASLKPGERAWYEKETSPTAAIVVEAVSRALPDSAYLTELHLESATLRMVGLASDPPSLIAPLEHSGHLADVHFFAPTTRESDGALFRFHIEARVKPRFTIAAEGP
jgi:general secretion pathway protein L